MKRSYLIYNVIIPLSLGMIFYYLFLPETFFVEFIDKLLGISYHIPINTNNNILKYIRYYLLDFLWAYSLISLITFIFDYERKINLLVFLFMILMEVIQLIPSVRGTFDVCDIVVEIIAGILVILLSRRILKKS